LRAARDEDGLPAHRSNAGARVLALLSKGRIKPLKNTDKLLSPGSIKAVEHIRGMEESAGSAAFERSDDRARSSFSRGAFLRQPGQRAAGLLQFGDTFVERGDARAGHFAGARAI